MLFASNRFTNICVVLEKPKEKRKLYKDYKILLLLVFLRRDREQSWTRARRDHCLSWSSSGAGGLARVGVGSGTVSNLGLGFRVKALGLRV